MTTHIAWDKRADAAHKTLEKRFWNADLSVYSPSYPWANDRIEDPFHYWWQAHALDVLVDGLERTGDPFYENRINELLHGVIISNEGSITNNYYDDMLWMALALLRAHNLTKSNAYLGYSRVLWNDIKTGWNDHCGGGIAWRKQQLDYKNTPSNGPAVILAARLYQLEGQEEDLDWAKRIFHWLTKHLVDPETGFVWDGMNREQDGKIDKDWEYTYCQGVYMGAAHELFKCTGDSTFLAKASRTADTAIVHLANDDLVLLAEGDSDGDCGLFKGIFVRYLANLVMENGNPLWQEFFLANGHSLWERARSPEGFFANSWEGPVKTPVSLSVQLSGTMLLESLARMQQSGNL
ncbi:MAG: glycosyl hydrolase [Firmicutes bacterium]|nr:glycosyl hydrolase [Bacillota bacterium]